MWSIGAKTWDYQEIMNLSWFTKYYQFPAQGFALYKINYKVVYSMQNELPVSLAIS